MIKQIAADADRNLGGKTQSALYIDDTGFAKKGEKSVGVHRQWIGQLGKVENCQVGVFAALSCKKHVQPINFRLYFPEAWTKDKKRCKAAGVPKESMEFKRKHDLALDMIVQARRQGMRYNWIGFDGFYGEDPAFLRQIDDMKEIFEGTSTKTNVFTS